MKYIKNEKGITLVELIAALALVTIVAILIMTTLSIGIQRSVIEGEKTRIQQEANLMVSKLLDIHQKGNCYQLEITPTKDLVVIFYNNITKTTCGSEIAKSQPINSQNYNIRTTNPSEIFKIINPRSNNNAISIVLSLDSRSTITYEINTTLSRYKTN
ncbi:prepilin-type N-terminal cleavage/methylation domain-containing protein [Paenisporosarcina indica]|uniref:prepilin-type N-terminal cleavage/methylation domain-containing protein n=1 Tax=Paenisporosarcina indica TaxID=650093 RepID=UPI00094FB883|nr:type II secretion system protein [Paenisporosarcina indica]